MMRHRLFVLGVALVFGVTAGLAAWHYSEPRVNGHPITYWIQPWMHSRTETPESVAAAYAAMGDRHVQWLVSELNWRPSVFRTLFAALLNACGFSVSSQTPNDRREWAAGALGRLGERAVSALPILTVTSTNAVEPGGLRARAAARAALVNLGRQSVEPYAEIVRDPSDPNWFLGADVLARVGTNYPGSAEIFAEVMFGSNPPAIRARAAYLYGLSSPRLDEALPNLVRALNDAATRQSALQRILILGSNALPTTQAVMTCLTDADVKVRRTATNTLHSIAPELATALGIR
jgi:hypothetical protein